jgi:HK97 family phage prohead protease
MTADALIARRERKFARMEVKMLDGVGAFAGYASLFGEVDLGKDRVERGAFLRSLARRGAGGIRMLFQHDPAEPIGSWRVIREDGRGLYVEGVLSDGVSRAREVRELIKARAVDGLSIGFQTVRAKSDPKTGIRQILEADLWEISVVTFPMLPGARISDVKGGAGAMRLTETGLVRAMQDATRSIRGFA